MERFLELNTFSIHERNQVVKSIIENIDYSKTLIEKDCLNNITHTISKDVVQNLIYFKSSEINTSDSVVRDIIVRELIRCEEKASGGSMVMIVILSKFLENIKNIKSRTERIKSLETLKDNIVHACSEISPYVEKADIKDIKKIIKYNNFSKDINRLLYGIIDEIDPRNGCNVERGNKRKSYVEKKSGHIFKSENLNLQLYNISKWKKENVSCILVDGIIERVSQINHVLELFSEKRSPLILICRKASEEVRETIRINFLRNTLDIILIEVGFELDFIHFFNDMSALFSCDYANIKKGDVISSMLKDIIFSIDNVEIEGKIVTLRKNRNNSSIFLKNYISDVSSTRYKIDESSMDIEELENIKKIIDSRVSFLSSTRSTLTIGVEDISYDPYTISKIDKLFRSLKDISTFGTVSIKNIKTNNDMIMTIKKSINKNIFSQKEIFEGFISAYSVYKSLIKAEKIFTIDR